MTLQLRIWGDYRPKDLAAARRLDDRRIADDPDALKAVAGGPMSCVQLGEYFGCSDETIRLMVVGAIESLQGIGDTLEAWVEDGQVPPVEWQRRFLCAVLCMPDRWNEYEERRYRIEKWARNRADYEDRLAAMAEDLGVWPPEWIALHPLIEGIMEEIRMLPALLAEAESRGASRPEPESLSIGELRTTRKGRVVAGSYGTAFRVKRKLKLLPEDSLNTPEFLCNKLGCTLRTASCALRWEKANGDDYHEQLEPCRGCTVGLYHHEQMSRMSESRSTSGDETYQENAHATPSEGTCPEGLSSVRGVSDG